MNLEDELANEYLTECTEHLTEVEADLLAIVRSGAVFDEEQINRVFRGVHSIKGGAGFFDLNKIRELAHRMEDLLAKIRAREIPISPARIQLLLGATDQLNSMIQNPSDSESVDITGSLNLLSAACQPVPEQPSSDRPRLRILLAEDDLASRLLMQKALHRYGECYSAVNGKEAVEAFRIALDEGRPYGLICMDIMMPEMDGLEAVRQVRALEEKRGVLSSSGAKIVMITALDDVKHVAASFKALCDAYLTKPIDLAKLRTCIQSHVG